MHHRFNGLIILLILLLFQIQFVYACRFNVRETGFVNLENQQYLLVGYVNNQTSSAIVTAFQKIAENMLSGSNIEFELINIDNQKHHPAVKYLNNKEIKSTPITALISPDGQSQVFPIKKPDKVFEKSLKDMLNKILYSPIRKKLQNQVIDNYGVILLIEGPTKNENVLAQQAAREALKNVTKKMDLMPKMIKNPPVLIVLNYKNRLDDPILLWTLGLDVDKIDKPYAAIFYGRARWLGPLFRDKEISKNNLSEILFVIGVDCECGLDKNWLQGTMLPMLWDKKILSRITRNLEFDPENPMIKIEINQIMRTGLYEYSESVGHTAKIFNPDSANTPRQGINYYENNRVNRNTNTTQLDSSRLQSDSNLKKSILITIGILAVLFITGLFAVYRRSKSN